MNRQKKISLLVGLGLLAVAIVFYSVIDRNDSKGEFFQQVLVSLAGAGIASIFFGFLEIQLRWLRAGGPLAVFVMLYLVPPAGMSDCRELTLTGSIIDSEGKAVPDATVLIEASPFKDQSTSTGKFEINSIPLDYRGKRVVVKCFHGDYNRGSEEVILNGCINEINFKGLTKK